MFHSSISWITAFILDSSAVITSSAHLQISVYLYCLKAEQRDAGVKNTLLQSRLSETQYFITKAPDLTLSVLQACPSYVSDFYFLQILTKGRACL